MSSNDPQADAAVLRHRAEALIRGEAAPAPEHLMAFSPEAMRTMLHELQVHQIELEMQNEELRRTQLELQVSRTHYFDLFELTPVAYCLLDETGLILEANLTAVTLLGVTRNVLVKRPLSLFILEKDLGKFFQNLKQLLGAAESLVCDVRMVKANGTQFWAHLDSVAVNGTDGAAVCRVTFSDISKLKQAEAALQRAHDELEQRVAERTEKLQQANEILLTEITQRKQAEWALQERVKELECLHKISAIKLQPDISFIEQMEGIVELIPAAWQFPEITAARITLKEETYQTKNFRETPWIQVQEVMVNGSPIGRLEVCYLEVRPASDEGPFMFQERNLIEIIAERIGENYARRQMEALQHESEERYEKLAAQTGTIAWKVDAQGLYTYISPVAELSGADGSNHAAL